MTLPGFADQGGQMAKLTSTQLFLALTLAIFLGGFALFFASKLYLDYEAEANAKAMAKELSILAEQRKKEREQQEKEARQRRAKLEAQRRADAAARQTLRQTCDFWRSTYRKTGRDYDRMMRDQACARL